MFYYTANFPTFPTSCGRELRANQCRICLPVGVEVTAGLEVKRWLLMQTQDVLANLIMVSILPVSGQIGTWTKTNR